MKSHIKTATMMLVAAAIFVFVSIVGSPSETARALPPGGVADVLAVGQALTGATFGNGTAVAITCGTTATAIGGGGGWNAASCYTTSSAAVYVGGADVGTSGFCIATTGCGGIGVQGDFTHSALYCRVASGTQPVYCLGVR